MMNKITTIRNNIACYGCNFLFNIIATQDYKDKVNWVVDKGFEKLDEEVEQIRQDQTTNG